MSTLFSTEMSTESLVSSTTSSSFTGDLDSYLDKIGSKAPQSWRKPRSRIYDHNRQILALVEVECENKWKFDGNNIPIKGFNPAATPKHHAKI